VSGSLDTTLRLWDIETGKCLRLFDGHWLGITSVAITLMRVFVVSASEACGVTIVGFSFRPMSSSI
jgi:WD40 repeat protein